MAQTLLISETAEPLGAGLSNSQFFHKQRAAFLSGGGGKNGQISLKPVFSVGKRWPRTQLMSTGTSFSPGLPASWEVSHSCLISCPPPSLTLTLSSLWVGSERDRTKIKGHSKYWNFKLAIVALWEVQILMVRRDWFPDSHALEETKVDRLMVSLLRKILQ